MAAAGSLCLFSKRQASSKCAAAACGFTSSDFSNDSTAPLKSMVLTRLLPSTKFDSRSSSAKLCPEPTQPLNNIEASKGKAARNRFDQLAMPPDYTSRPRNTISQLG